jgi:membrane-associated phospholipid phosphatase
MPALSAFPRRIWDDLRALVTRPLHFDGQDWTRLGLGTAAVGVTAAFDDRVRTYVQDHSGAGSRDLANRLRPLGSWQGAALMVAFLGVGELAGSANLAATGADGIEATLFATGLVTPFIQTVVGRERPSAGQGPHSFQPFSGAASFPSGEVTQAFALASVVTAHSDSVVLRSVVWGLAGVVGWERIALDRHWASDVVAGALIGSAVGRWVVHRQEPSRRTGVVWGWQPIVGPRRFGVHVAASW